MANTNDIKLEWEELSEDYKTLEEIHRNYINKRVELLKIEMECQKQIQHQKYRLNILRNQLNKTSKLNTSEIQLNKIDLAEQETLICKRQMQIRLFEDSLPNQSRSGIYLRIILGNVDVSFLSDVAKFKYKDEYEKFKLVCHLIALIFIILNLFLNNQLVEVMYFFILVWYYCTISIRESVLRANGSKIHIWWRVHHAIATITTIILLIWPRDSICWQKFKQQFFYYNILTCLVQYLQFNYQRGALYRLRSLGQRKQKNNMDISFEGFQYWMWRELAFLYPFLFIAYFFQLYNAYTLYSLTQIFAANYTWHVPSLGYLMLILFIGNSITTLSVIPNKIRNKMFISKNKK